ncbi:MAG: sensor histidine kinase [Desulfatibacillaceae bacterium]
MNRLPDNLLDFLENRAGILWIALDGEGRVIRANAFARSVLGARVEDMSAKDVFLDFAGKLDLAALAARDEPAMLHVTCADQRPRSFFFTVAARPEGGFDAFGQPDFQHMDRLEKNLNEMTRQLSDMNRDLQKANSELTRLDEVKNQFIGMAAHDLRNPISHILTCSQFLYEEAHDCLEDEEKEMLEVIETSSRFMLSLVEDLLDLSAIESGRLNLDTTDVNLPELVKRNVQLNALLAARKDINLRLNHLEQIPRVRADAHKIEQVLNNLLSNAIKFSPRGTTVEASLFRTRKDVIVSVRDQGPGIPGKELSNLFKPFSRTSVRTSEGEKSTGLGLAISQRIILGHNGRIWVDSEEGVGTTFCFSLPISEG